MKSGNTVTTVAGKFRLNVEVLMLLLENFQFSIQWFKLLSFI